MEKDQHFSECPYCQTKMEKGYLLSQRPISWNNELRKLSCMGRYPISGSRIWCNWAPSMRCPSCKTVILKHL